METLISIITPVYNTEKYLPECIQSVFNQTYTNWELLLIDDGSPDGSGAICDEYAARDNRVKVFHKENGGVSSARNVGLDNARGEWITFLDSDDMFEPQYLEKCLFYAKKYNIDIIKFYFSGTYFSNLTIDRQEEFSLLSINDYLKINLNLGSIGLYKKNIVSVLRFNEKMKYAEDQLFNYELIQRAGNCGLINMPLYFYRANETSATKTVDGLSRLKSCKYLYDFAIDNPNFKERINKTIVSLIVESCSDDRVPLKDICSAVKNYNIHCPSNVSKTIKTFCYIQKVSVSLATILCRFRSKF